MKIHLTEFDPNPNLNLGHPNPNSTPNNAAPVNSLQGNLDFHAFVFTLGSILPQFT